MQRTKVRIRKTIDFKIKAKEKNIARWDINKCHKCDYQASYQFSTDYEQVFYDSGCKCINKYDLHKSSWEMVAGHYSIQDNADIQFKHDQFWGFK